jgi:hypothetical protein
LVLVFAFEFLVLNQKPKTKAKGHGKKKDGDRATTIVKAERRRKFVIGFDQTPGLPFVHTHHRTFHRASDYRASVWWCLRQSVVPLIYRPLGCGRVIADQGLDLRYPSVRLVDFSFCHLPSLLPPHCSMVKGSTGTSPVSLNKLYNNNRCAVTLL